MDTSYKVNLPGGARVCVQAFSNAAYSQIVTIQPPTGAKAVFKGSGENNKPMSLEEKGFLSINSNAWPSFTTPGDSTRNQGYTVSVVANGKPSTVVGQVLTLQPSGNIVLGFVSSEDSGDKDWNDSVVLFTSYIP